MPGRVIVHESVGLHPRGFYDWVIDAHHELLQACLHRPAKVFVEA